MKREMIIDTVTETEEGGKITTYRRETRREAMVRNREDLRKKLNDLSNSHPVFFETTSFLASMGAIFIGACVVASFQNKDNEGSTEG